MTTHDELVSAFGTLLAPGGYALRVSRNNAGPVTVQFAPDLLPGPIIALPDVHLGNGGPGDVFLNGTPERAKRLQQVLQAMHDYSDAHHDAYVIQLGDWFDVWRTSGHDVAHMDYGPIQNAAVYQPILDLDALLGLPHIIGNHDASFLNALPDRRTGQAGSFRLGGWLGRTVYAIHGHQSEIEPPPNSPFDQFFVALATSIAGFVPGIRTFEAYIDRNYGIASALGATLLHGLRLMREDPGPSARTVDTRSPPPGADGTFVLRERADRLAMIATAVANTTAGLRKPRLLVVGHSHNPCVAWSSAAGSPILIVDAGGWVYEQANLLLAAGDRASVFDVVPA